MYYLYYPILDPYLLFRHVIHLLCIYIICKPVHCDGYQHFWPSC